jgi:hypothetical protein
MAVDERTYTDAVEELEQLDDARRALREGDPAEASRLIEVTRERLLHRAPPVPVAVAAKLLDVTQPTIRSWLDTGVLKDAGRKPRAVTTESVVRVHRLLAELRERGHDGSLRATLLARLDDELTLNDDRLQSSIGSMRRGRGDRPPVAGQTR